MAVTHHQTRKRTCSFSSPTASKAPRLTSSKSASSFGSIRDRAMACAIHPTHLTQSHIWPDAAVERGGIASNANACAAHNANLSKQIEYSNVFRKQLSGFVAQIAYEHALERAIRPYPHPPLDFASSDTSVTRLPTERIFEPAAPSHVTLFREPPAPPHKPRRRHSTGMLRASRPRVSSPLSPSPPQTPLPGPPRRPMPPRKGRDASLLKQAVCNTERGRQIAALGPHAAVRVLEAHTRLEAEDVAMDHAGERLGQSWVFVPCEDWEMVDTGEISDHTVIERGEVWKIMQK